LRWRLPEGCVKGGGSMVRVVPLEEAIG